ncbi:MAG: putative metalloprotease CJM1_0395 family protein [Pseudomonadota bacterium]
MLLESQIVALMPTRALGGPGPGQAAPAGTDGAEVGRSAATVTAGAVGRPAVSAGHGTPILAPGLGERARRALVLSGAGGPRAPASRSGLTPAEEDLISRLAARDREVRAHEQAHARVGGQHAGSPSYTYQTGPDGKRYAIGGSVAIDVSPVPGDPEATIAKMDRVKAAALAPAEPSAADRRIATLAEAARREAETILSAMRRLATLEAAAEGRAVADGARSALLPSPIPPLAFTPAARELEQRV